MLGPQQLGGAARRQLAAWERIAENWEIYRASGSRVIRCAACFKGVMLFADESGRRYRYTPDEELAHIVLHLRNHHQDLDPDPAP